ncbi:MAG: amidase [Pseudomonadota bacterium]|nr:amidase [Pseudomonadota bacterium]
MMSPSFSPEATESCLEHIENYDGKVNAFITVMADAARRRASALAAAAREGRPQGLLAGMPVSVKDCVDVAGVACTNGSLFFKDYVPNEDASIVSALRAAGAVILGKTNLHEFAFGSTTQNPHYGATRNPWNLDHIPSGSSGGAGAAVAARMCIGAVGSDTGGSVRTPAALNGVTGLRPSLGSIPMSGSKTRICPAIDTVGPLGLSVEVVARLFSVMAFYDDNDVNSVRHTWDNYLASLGSGINGLRIGIPSDYFFDDLAPGVGEAVETGAKVLEALGAELVSIHLEGAAGIHADVMPMVWADVYEYHRERLEKEPERFGEDVRSRMLLGREVSGRDYAEALRHRAHWNRTIDRTLQIVDMIITPTAPATAPSIADSRNMLATTHHLTRFTFPFSWACLPGLSVPCGLSAEGMPIGMLLNGRSFEEGLLFRAGHAYQEATDWHLRLPPLLSDQVSNDV